MHPDEVTECIVDAALGAGKPFAVVPCCVFSRRFPLTLSGLQSLRFEAVGRSTLPEKKTISTNVMRNPKQRL